MNTLLLSLALVSRVMLAPVVHDRPAFQPMAFVAVAPAAMLTQQQPPPTTPTQPPPVNVEVNHINRGWYANPVWVAIGGLALVVVILMIVMAARGGGGSGGTTVVRG